MPEVDTEIGSVFYLDMGEGDPIVLVHGNFGSSRWWKPLLGRITGHRTIAPDLPCFGRSAKPESDHRMSTYADYLNDFVGEIGIDGFDLVGHSLGGAVAVCYSLRYPQKVENLVLVSPPSAAGMNLSHTEKAMFKLGGSNWCFLKQLLGKLISRSHPLFGEILEDASAMKSSGIAGNIRGLEEFNVCDDLEDLEPFLYLVRGSEDPIVEDEDLEEYQKYARDYIIFEDGGHAPFLEKPEGFAETLGDILS